VRKAAVLHPGGLTAKELRGQLDERPDLVREVRLLTTVEEEVGTLTESGGSAAMVQRFAPEAVEDVDILFLCGPAAESRRVLEAVPGARAVILSPDAEVRDAPPYVAGVNLPPHEAVEPVVLSPQPGAILLAHVLHPLQQLGLRRAEATLLQPVSVFPGEALDQLFEQARNLLTFQPVGESAHWQRQLAFNLLPTDVAGDALREQVEAVLADGAAITAQVLQAGVFHSFAGSLHVTLEPDPGLERIREAYAERPGLRWAEEEPLGPVDAAAAEDVLIGHVRSDRGRGGSYWLWAVMDNLTRGGASNAIALAEAVLR